MLNDKHYEILKTRKIKVNPNWNKYALGLALSMKKDKLEKAIAAGSNYTSIYKALLPTAETSTD